MLIVVTAIILCTLLITLVVSIKLKSPRWKGNLSEQIVRRSLLSLPDEYIVLNDLFFESNGRSTQIDHLVISPYGVFVIETKGYRGWILGGENSQYWTQVIYHSRHQFYNPLLQNGGHVRFLRHILPCPVHIPFFSIVVFDDEADLKVKVKSHTVVNLCHLIEAITQHQRLVLDKAAIDWIVEVISKNASVASKDSVKRHQQAVANRQEETAVNIQQGICPRCGRQLVLRQGRYGYFYGCSNYPNCKFTLNA